MEITQEKSGDLLTIKLVGRLDANWCDHVENALTAAVRSGEHHIFLDMAGVQYVSSAGLRVLLSLYKQLRAIKGSFGVVNPSTAARAILEMSGLSTIIAKAEDNAPVAAEQGLRAASPHASYEVFSSPSSGLKLSAIGDGALLRQGGEGGEKVSFTKDTFAIGIGALGGQTGECTSRLGEFLAVGGAAAFQPSDGSSRPDFMVSEGNLVPEGFLYCALSGRGSFPTLIRFEAKPPAVGMAELLRNALDLTNAPAIAAVAVTETAGLVGATLRKSPAPATAGTDRFGFPQIRDWLSFTSERAYRDTTSLIVGVAAREKTSYDSLLRPIGDGINGHFHAASFPYRPLQKGRIDLQPTIDSLFESHNLQAVLHLLSDTREITGAGESEFLRGALWVSPISIS